jgi:hypothetical protein
VCGRERSTYPAAPGRRTAEDGGANHLGSLLGVAVQPVAVRPTGGCHVAERPAARRLPPRQVCEPDEEVGGAPRPERLAIDMPSQKYADASESARNTL